MRPRATTAAAVATLLTAAAVAPAAAAEPAAQYPATVCAMISVSTTHPLPGETILVSGVDFRAHAAVRLELHSAPRYLTTARTDARGSFATRVRIPEDIHGRHRLVAATGRPDNANCPGNPYVAIYVQGGVTASTAPPGGHHGGTSFTGIDVLLILLAAAVLIGTGVALDRGGKRRHAHSGHPLID
jgi:hypothetical protein